MEETLGQQYALQVAVQTMKERCLQLQQRLLIVEEENVNLRVKYHTDNTELCTDSTKSEAELLRQKVAKLTKRNSQLTHNVLMVATENRHLWDRLLKLTQANQTLGDHLTKINDTLNTVQSSPTQTTLIRSKTFTHETPPPKLVKKVEEDSDASLEDISLKIINSIAQEKYELEKQCAQMTELQTDTFLTNSVGFAYPNDTIDNSLTEISQNMEKLIFIKDSLLEQKQKLKQQFDTLKIITEGNISCKSCKESQKLRNENKITKASVSSDVEIEKICPVCNKLFFKDINEFVHHVQGHFAGEDDFLLEDYVQPNLSNTNNFFGT